MDQRDNTAFKIHQYKEYLKPWEWVWTEQRSPGKEPGDLTFRGGKTEDKQQRRMNGTVTQLAREREGVPQEEAGAARCSTLPTGGLWECSELTTGLDRVKVPGNVVLEE